MSQKLSNQDHNTSGQTIIINQQQKDSNGVGTAGFILALIAIL